MPYKDALKRKDYHKKYGKRYEKLHKRERSLSRKKWRKKHPDKAYARDRYINLNKKGWTIEGFDTAERLQFGKCAICSKVKKLCADHEHTTPPKPRALLCVNCNSLLGHAYESPEILEAAASYVRKWKV